MSDKVSETCVGTKVFIEYSPNYNIKKKPYLCQRNEKTIEMDRHINKNQIKNMYEC